MGFTTGFTGGVALTLSVAYLSVLAHQRNREQQGAALRAQAITLQSIIDPLPAPLPPTRSEIAAAQRETAIEVAKDRWNREVLNALRWAQSTDWDEVREGLEQGVSNLWSKTFGDGAPEEVKSQLQSGARKAESKVEDTGKGVADTARAAYLKAKSKSISVEEAAENKALEARLKLNKEAASAAGEAKGAIASAWEAGKGKAKDLAETAKAAVGSVEEKAQASKDGQASPAVSQVQKALQQRYEASEAKEKTVAETINERYIPLDQRDNTVLRGL